MTLSRLDCRHCFNSAPWPCPEHEPEEARAFDLHMEREERRDIEWSAWLAAHPMHGPFLPATDADIPW